MADKLKKRGNCVVFKIKVDEKMNSSVSGIYAIGDASGGALIRNAINHGYLCALEVKKYVSGIKNKKKEAFDVAIIGAGPGGISAGITLKKEGANYVIFDMQRTFQTIREYPDDKPLYDAKPDVPKLGFLEFNAGNKKEILSKFESNVKKEEINVREWEKTIGIKKNGEVFEVTTNKGKYFAHSVILAVGKREPKRLGIVGESLPKVEYYIQNPEKYNGKKILVVGGGNSSAEAAIMLAEKNEVTVSYRKECFFRLIEENETGLENMKKNGKMKILFKTIPKEITEKEVVLSVLDAECKPTGEEMKIENDFVFIYTGFELPEKFLKEIGVEME